MKLLVPMILSMASLMAHAQLPSDLNDIKCGKEINSILKKNGAKDEWTRTVDPQPGVRAYRTPTKEFAKWVEVQSFADPYVFIFDTKKSKIYQFDKKSCAPLMNVEGKPLEVVQTKKAPFTDSDLKSLVESEDFSLVYVWSPVMTYSMTEMGVFINIAKELNVKFVPVLDYNFKSEDADKYLAPHVTGVKIQRGKSLELYMREANIHFPSSYIVGNNRISPRIFGVLTPDLLRERVLDELAALKRVSR